MARKTRRRRFRGSKRSKRSRRIRRVKGTRRVRTYYRGGNTRYNSEGGDWKQILSDTRAKVFGFVKNRAGVDVENILVNPKPPPPPTTTTPPPSQ